MKAVLVLGFVAFFAVAYGADVECPAVDGDTPKHLPNPEDCGSFYKCFNGVGYLQECNPGLHFNPVLEVCDWPENAGCQASSAESTTPEAPTTL